MHLVHEKKRVQSVMEEEAIWGEGLVLYSEGGPLGLALFRKLDVELQFLQ